MKSKQNHKVRAKRDIWLLLQSRLFQFLILILPVQLGFHFWPDWALLVGVRVDYLAPTIYLTDLIIVGILVLNFKNLKKVNLYWVLALGIFAIFNIIYSSIWQIALLKWIKYLEFFLLGFVVYLNRAEFSEKVKSPLSIAVIYTSVIGILQFILGKTIGGVLYLLGERSFTVNTPGIALFNLWGIRFLRPYATLAHPNALAGFLGIALIFLIFSKRERFQDTAMVLGFITLFLTFSQNAWISLIISLLVYKVSRGVGISKAWPSGLKNLGQPILIFLIFVSIIFPMISKVLLGNFHFQESIRERLELGFLSGMIFSQNPLVGVGAGNFIVSLPKLLYINNFNWWLQPVHNIFLLILTETGIVGLLVFFYLMSKAIKELNPILIFILLTGLFDHYWLTLQQNLLLFAIFIGLLISTKIDTMKKHVS